MELFYFAGVATGFLRHSTPEKLSESESEWNAMIFLSKLFAYPSSPQSQCVQKWEGLLNIYLFRQNNWEMPTFTSLYHGFKMYKNTLEVIMALWLSQ